MDTGLLVLRLVLGLGLAAHGAQKLFGWFGGQGVSGTGGFLESLGFHPGRTFALTAGMGEFAGGLLTALGLLGPVGPALIIMVMVVAMVTVHIDNGFFTTRNGIELPLLYVAGGMTLAVAGFGRFALDQVLGLSSIWSPEVSWIAIALGILAGLGSLALRQQTAAEPHTPA